jgi:hypothetical protein
VGWERQLDEIWFRTSVCSTYLIPSASNQPTIDQRPKTVNVAKPCLGWSTWGNLHEMDMLDHADPICFIQGVERGVERAAVEYACEERTCGEAQRRAAPKLEQPRPISSGAANQPTTCQSAPWFAGAVGDGCCVSHSFTATVPDDDNRQGDAGSLWSFECFLRERKVFVD